MQICPKCNTEDSLSIEGDSGGIRWCNECLTYFCLNCECDVEQDDTECESCGVWL